MRINIIIVFLFLFLSCKENNGIKTDKTLNKFSPELTNSVAFSIFFEKEIIYAKYKKILQNELGRLNLKASEYYVVKPSIEKNNLVFDLYHNSAFEYSLQTRGNPGGKCRTIVIDAINYKVISNSVWK